MGSVASFVGVDQGKKSLVIYARNADHSWHKRGRIGYGDWERLRQWFEQLPRPVRVAVEASYIYYPLVDRLIAWGCDVRLANPRKLKLIYGSSKKTDRLDAMKLAQLMTTNDLPESHIPSHEERPDRALLATREHMLRKRTGLVNHLRAKLRQFELPEPAGNLYSPGAVAAIRKTLKERKFDVSLKLAIEMLLDMLEASHRAMDKIDVAIEKKSDKDPRMTELKKIECIGGLGSFTLVRTLGDFGRFKKSRQVAKYAGLTPRTDISSDDKRYGRIDREGPPILRRILTQITLSAINTNAHVDAYHTWLRKSRGKSKKRARVACTRKLLVGLWAAVQDGVRFDYSRCFEIPGVARKPA